MAGLMDRRPDGTQKMQELIENYQAQHEDFASQTQTQSWLNEIQRQSLSQLGETGFPTLSDENIPTSSRY